MHMMLFWPDDIFFPVLDIIRLALLKETTCRQIFDNDLVEKLLYHFADSQRVATQLMATRAFANVFKHEHGRTALGKYLNLVLTKIPTTETKNANLQIALATLLLNLTIKNYATISSEVLVSRIVSLFECLSDLEAVFRLLTAVGNLVAQQKTVIIQQFKNTAKFMDRLQKYRLDGVPEHFVKINEIANDLVSQLS